MGIADWLLAFIGKLLAVPELGALLPAIGVGMAMAYLATLPLSGSTAIKWAQNWAAVWIVLAVVSISFYLIRTPRMFLWALTVGVFIPKTYEWLMAIIYHRYPWLKPKAMLTGPEMQARGDN